MAPKRCIALTSVPFFLWINSLFLLLEPHQSAPALCKIYCFWWIMSVAVIQVPVAFLFICTAAQVGGEVGFGGSSWACVNTSWEPRCKRLFSAGEGIFFYCPLFLTQNQPLKTLDTLMALLWPKECFVYAYWQNISVLWHVYTVTRINWRKKKKPWVCWPEHLSPFYTSAPWKPLRITVLKNTDDLCFP